jgi:hypothetical protein
MNTRLHQHRPTLASYAFVAAIGTVACVSAWAQTTGTASTTPSLTPLTTAAPASRQGPTSVVAPDSLARPRTAAPLTTPPEVRPFTNGVPTDATPAVSVTPGLRAPVDPTPSASVPIRATSDTLGPTVADRLITGPVGAAANRSTTTPSLPAAQSGVPLNCRTAGGTSVACPDDK